MDVLDFNSLINQLLDTISKEQKQIFLLLDFNINLLNYNEHQSNEFLDTLGPTLKKLFISYHLHRKKKVTRAAGKTFFYLIQTKCYFLFQMLQSP